MTLSEDEYLPRIYGVAASTSQDEIETAVVTKVYDALVTAGNRVPKKVRKKRHNLSLTFIASSTSPSSPPPPPTTSTSPSPSTEAVPPFLSEQFRPTRFLTDQEYSNLQFLHDFTYARPVKSGNLLIRAMRSGEMDETVGLLAESFADSMLLPGGYLSLLRFLVRQYLLERRSALPHAVTLVGFYKEEGKGGGGEAEVLAGTVEVVFGRKGSNASPPSPAPPKDMPYICNMTVKEDLRR